MTGPTIYGEGSAIEQLSRIASGTLTAEDAVSAALERCRANEDLNAVTSLRAKEALDEARAVDRASAAGQAIGLLAGLPIIVKDNIAVGGHVFTGGSPAFADHVADADASVVARLRAAGAIVIGKANLHELAFGTTSNNAWTGPVRNPHDPARICGGSSGGSAAAVVAGLVTVALGTDTGGSGRIPAALCGCVGFRPTVGRYPSDGVMLLTTTRDAISLTANNIDDVMLLDEVITGDATDERVVLPELRLGVPSPFATEGLSDEVGAAFAASLRSLAAAGVSIVPVDAAELEEIDQLIGLPIVLAEAAALWRDYAQTRLGIDLATFASRIASPDVRAVFEALATGEGPVTAAQYAGIRNRELPRLRAAYTRLFGAANIDALIFPTVVTTAPLIGEDETLRVAGEDRPLFATMTRNVGPGSLAGIPGVTIPIANPGGEMPVGLAIDALPGSDRRILAIAGSIERYFDRIRPAT